MPRLTRFLFLAVLFGVAMVPTGCKKAGRRGFCTVILGISGCSEIVSYTINGESRMRFVDSVFASRRLFNESDPFRYTDENCDEQNGTNMKARLGKYYPEYPNFIDLMFTNFRNSRQGYFYLSGLFSKSNPYLVNRQDILDSLPPYQYWNFEYEGGSYRTTQIDSLGVQYIISVHKLNSNQNVQDCFN
jgi:hypothetical protein